MQLPYTWGYVDSINRIRRSTAKVVKVVVTCGNRKAISGGMGRVFPIFYDVWGELATPPCSLFPLKDLSPSREAYRMPGGVYLEEPVRVASIAQPGLTWRNQFLLVTQPTGGVRCSARIQSTLGYDCSFFIWRSP